MNSNVKMPINLENFNELWNLGDPAVIEKRFRELLSYASASPDKSIYLQICSQIALTQALQKRFDEGHKTLDDAEKLLASEEGIAKVRILLERGRVFQQEGMVFQQDEKTAQAKIFFAQAYDLSLMLGLDYHTIDAAHMIAIISKKTEDKIKWNQLAIDIAQRTNDQRAHGWLGSLYNNLGHNLLEVKQFENALRVFRNVLNLREKEGVLPNIRVAKWAIARAQRLLGQIDEALALLDSLIKDYEIILSSGNLDMPFEMFKMTRGLVFEEITEVYSAKTKIFAKLVELTP